MIMSEVYLGEARDDSQIFQRHYESHNHKEGSYDHQRILEKADKRHQLSRLSVEEAALTAGPTLSLPSFLVFLGITAIMIGIPIALKRKTKTPTKNANPIKMRFMRLAVSILRSEEPVLMHASKPPNHAGTKKRQAGHAKRGEQHGERRESW